MPQNNIPGLTNLDSLNSHIVADDGTRMVDRVAKSGNFPGGLLASVYVGATLEPTFNWPQLIGSVPMPLGNSAYILTGLAAYLMETGMRLQTQEVSLWTGRPYGLPGIKARDDRGDFRDVEGIDLAELDLWMPDVACMRERSFGPANLRFAPRDVDWRVDAIEMLRMTRRKAQRCSG